MLPFRASNSFMVRISSNLMSGIYTRHKSGSLAHTKFTPFPAALKLPKLFAHGNKCLGASRCLIFGFRRAWWAREKTHAVVRNSHINIDTKTQLSTFTRAENLPPTPRRSQAATRASGVILAEFYEAGGSRRSQKRRWSGVAPPELKRQSRGTSED